MRASPRIGPVIHSATYTRTCSNRAIGENRRGMAVVKYLIVLLILATSVSACETDCEICFPPVDSLDFNIDWSQWGEVTATTIWQCDVLECEVCPTRSVDTIKPPPDTAREYMRVDTVVEYVRIPWVDWMWSDSAHDWIPYTNHGVHLEYPDTTFDTTWFPKVQVWLTPEDAKRLKQAICEHDWLTSYVVYDTISGAIASNRIVVCGECGEKID